MINVEELRTWLNSQKGRWPVISEETGYPYFSLQKFADGRVSEPRVQRLIDLDEYRRRAA